MAIITISREMGSGGIPIAHKAAERLGYELIDGEALRAAAPDYGLSNEDLEQADEKPPAFVSGLDEKLAVDLHQIELIILEKALKGNVIVYGRGGQDLLINVPNVFRVRIVRPFKQRVESWAEREWIDPDYARLLVRKSDQQRAGFIKYYFDRDWDDPLNYDLIINTEKLGEAMAVELISKGVEDDTLIKQKKPSKDILGNLILSKKTEVAVLAEPGLDAMHIEFSATNGVIELGGHIHSEADRERVVQLAKEISGTANVSDQMKLVEYRNLVSDN